MNKRRLKYSFTKVINAVENLRCENLHHKKSQMHDKGVVCPVEYELHAHANKLREHMRDIGLL